MNRKLHINEQLLIDLLCANSCKAFEFVHDTFSPALHGSLIDLIDTDKENVSHVLEDGFSAVWQALQSYDHQQQRLYAWLLHMMHQLATVALKQLSRWPSVDELERLSIGLRHKLMSMHPNQRCVIELMYDQGYCKARIARALNLSHEAVDHLLNAGFRQLKTYLKCSLKANGTFYGAS